MLKWRGREFQTPEGTWKCIFVANRTSVWFLDKPGGDLPFVAVDYSARRPASQRYRWQRFSAESQQFDGLAGFRSSESAAFERAVEVLK